MVEINDNGEIKALHIKPDKTNLIYTWQIAVWTPVFSEFMHNYLIKRKHDASRGELYVGDVIQAALHEKFNIDTVLFENGSCLDIGTPDDLMRAVKTANTH